MSKTSRTIVTMPATAKKGEILEIRIIVQHDMESGFRHTETGQRVPRDIIRDFRCTYNGVEVFRAEMGSGIAANPYLSFFIVAANSGELRFDWGDDSGATGSERASIIVA